MDTTREANRKKKYTDIFLLLTTTIFRPENPKELLVQQKITAQVAGEMHEYYDK
jgi:hypothetical protein